MLACYYSPRCAWAVIAHEILILHSNQNADFHPSCIICYYHKKLTVFPQFKQSPMPITLPMYFQISWDECIRIFSNFLNANHQNLYFYSHLFIVLNLKYVLCYFNMFIPLMKFELCCTKVCIIIYLLPSFLLKTAQSEHSITKMI